MLCLLIRREDFEVLIHGSERWLPSNVSLKSLINSCADFTLPLFMTHLTKNLAKDGLIDDY